MDYRALNAITVPDTFRMPHVQDIKRRVSGKIFSVINLKEGYNQVMIAKNDIEKTAVKTP